MKLHQWLQKVCTSEILPEPSLIVHVRQNYMCNIYLLPAQRIICDAINYVHIENNSLSNSIRSQKGKTQMLPVNKLECHVCVCNVSSDYLCPLQDGNMTFFTFLFEYTAVVKQGRPASESITY